MDSYEIYGGKELFGDVSISGAKNSSLPLMAASLLTKEDVILQNIPHLSDILTMKELLETLGKDITLENHVMTIKQTEKISLKAPYDIVKTMRASVVVLGPLLGMYHEAEISLPGGCSIGNRPVDLHIKAMELLGAQIELKDGYISAKAPTGLKGTDLYLVSSTGVTVLGTANALMAATLGKGKTVIEPAAMEPEIGDLVDMLSSMGAKIQGKGTSVLTIQGVEKLGGTTHHVIPDRIETGTFIAMVACTGGEVTLHKTNADFLHYPLVVARQMGVSISLLDNETIKVSSHGKLKPTDISTDPYPNFPTDMQPQYMVMQSLANGESKFTENIFEDRFHHAAELVRMGADIRLAKGSLAIVHGVSFLKGAPVMASDLRAGAALVIAGLCAKEKTIVQRIYHIDRGYEDFEGKVKSLGGDIKRI